MASTVKLDLKRDKVDKLVETLSKETELTKKSHLKSRNYEYQSQNNQRLPRSNADELLDTGSEEKKGSAADSMEDYDPNEAATRLFREKEQQIVDLRNETSDLTSYLNQVRKEYDQIAAELAAMNYEDDVEGQRQEGEEYLEMASQYLEELKDRYEKTTLYFYTLEHMYKRLRDDKHKHVATLNTFEDALKVHTQELHLQEKLLTQVNKAKVEEQKSLSQLRSKIQQQRDQIEKKMDARRQEVQIRQKMAQDKQRAAKKEAKLNAKVHGDLTAKEEQKMRDKLKELEDEMNDVAKERHNLTVTMDRFYELYTAVRMSAGVTEQGSLDMRKPDTAVGGQTRATPTPKQRKKSLGSVGSVQSLMADLGDLDLKNLARPNATAIVERFLEMQRELQSIENRLYDLEQRYAHLQEVKKVLTGMLQPRAKSEVDEIDFRREEKEAYLKERDRIKRKLEGSREEFEKLRNLKVQFHQSIGSLHHRVTTLPTPYLGTIAPDESLRQRNTEWSVQTTVKIREIQQKLEYVKDAINIAEEGDDEVPDNDEDLGEDSLKPHINVIQKSAAANLMEPKLLDSTIEAMLMNSETGVRVKTKQGLSRGHQIPSAVIHNAAHKYTQAHSKITKTFDQGIQYDQTVDSGKEESMEQNQRKTSNKTGGTFSKVSVVQRRRNSRIDIQSALASAAAAAGEAEDDSSNEKKNKKRGLRAADLTKYIASAADMSGADVEEFMLGQKDAEEVPNRDRMKKDAQKISTDKVRRRRLQEQIQKESKSQLLEFNEE